VRQTNLQQPDCLQIVPGAQLLRQRNQCCHYSVVGTRIVAPICWEIRPITRIVVDPLLLLSTRLKDKSDCLPRIRACNAFAEDFEHAFLYI
jgi:hypothetical protein